MKCNMGYVWSQRDNISGASWVIRDHCGTVLMHSRRSEIHSKCEAAIQSWQWAMESMNSLKFKKVIFVTDTKEVIKAMSKPQEWPALAWKIDKMVENLASHGDWSVTYENPLANKGTFAIAQSVGRDGRTQSYVARGFPRRLESVFRSRTGEKLNG